MSAWGGYISLDNVGRLNKILFKAKRYGANNSLLTFFLSFWNSLISNYSHVLCALITVYFMCSVRTIYSYRMFCDTADIRLIYPDISITLPENLLFLEIYTYVSNKLTYCP